MFAGYIEAPLCVFCEKKIKICRYVPVCSAANKRKCNCDVDKESCKPFNEKIFIGSEWDVFYHSYYNIIHQWEFWDLGDKVVAREHLPFIPQVPCLRRAEAREKTIRNKRLLGWLDARQYEHWDWAVKYDEPFPWDVCCEENSYGVQD